MPRRETRTPRGHCISYVAEGSGPTLVLLASALESAAAWEEFGYVDAFRDAYSVIAIDLLGQGESQGSLDAADYSWEAVFEQITSVLDREQVTSCAVWGYANGAEVAWLLARRRPALVTAMVLGGIYLGEGLVDDAQAFHSATVEAMAAALDVGDWDGYFDLFPVEWGELARVRAPKINDPVVAAAGVRGDLTRPHGVVAPSVPTLAYWGDDVSFSRANADMALGLPLETLVVPGTQGDAFYDAEAVIATVRPFLNGLG